MKKQNLKSGKVAVLITIIVIAVALIGAACYYFFYLTKPTVAFKKVISSAVNTVSEAVKFDALTSTTASLDATVTASEDKIDSKTLELINGIDLSINLQVDNTAGKYVAKVGSTYNKKNLLNINLFLDTTANKTYLQAKDYIDKYIEIDTTSTVKTEDINAIGFKDEASAKKAIGIIEKSIESMMKDEYCTKESKGLDNTYVLKMTAAQIKSESKAMLTALKANTDFIACFKNTNAITKKLDEAIAKYDEANYVVGDLEVKVYAKGIKQDVYKVDAKTTIDKDVTLTEISIKDKTTYAYSVTENAKKVSEGTVNVTGDTTKDIVVDTTIDGVKANLKIKLSSEIVKSIEKVDTSKVTSIDKLTPEDIQTIMTKLEGSELYKIILPFLSEMSF